MAMRARRDKSEDYYWTRRDGMETDIEQRKSDEGNEEDGDEGEEKA
jgi:hypothetical protein